MKKLSKNEKRIKKSYWVKPELNKKLKKHCRITKENESEVVQNLLQNFLGDLL